MPSRAATQAQSAASMNDSFFDESDFFFLCKSTREKLHTFVARFVLRLNPHSDALDLLSLRYASRDVQAAWLEHLDNSGRAGPDLYLLDPSDRHFMICLRADDHVVFGVPYDLLNEGAILALLRQFDAIYGWGWSHEPPPQSLAEIKAHAQRSSPIYRRYCRGTMIQAGN